MIVRRSKEFARKDYEGLSNESKLALRQERHDLAKDLVRERREAINEFNNSIKAAETKKSNYEKFIKSLKEREKGGEKGVFDTPKADKALDYLNHDYKAEIVEAKGRRFLKYGNSIRRANTNSTSERDMLLRKQKRMEESRLENERLDREAAERRRQLLEEAKAVEERNKSSISKVGGFIKRYKKPLIGAGIGLTTVGTGIYLYNKNKKKKKEEGN